MSSQYKIFKELDNMDNNDNNIKKPLSISLIDSYINKDKLIDSNIGFYMRLDYVIDDRFYNARCNQSYIPFDKIYITIRKYVYKSYIDLKEDSYIKISYPSTFIDRLNMNNIKIFILGKNDFYMNNTYDKDDIMTYEDGQSMCIENFAQRNKLTITDELDGVVNDFHPGYFGHIEYANQIYNFIKEKL